MKITHAKHKNKILAQTIKICKSNELITKKRLCDLLRFIVNKWIDNDTRALKGYTIGLEVFGRPQDFNPDDDPIVRIHVGRLRRQLELYYLKEGFNDDIIISIPKGANVPVFNTSQTPDTRNDSPVKSLSISNQTKQTTIAVVPFINLTGDSGKEYLATGFTEDFIIELTKYEDFQVLVFANDNLSQQYAPSMNNGDNNAHFIIDGSIRINDNIIKTAVKLIDTHKRQHLWGENFEHNLDSIGLIELQEKICKQVVKVIAGEYGIVSNTLSEDSDKKNITEIETYDAILRFYYFENSLSTEAAQNAIVSLEKAIENDPNCGLVYSMLAAIYGALYALDYPGGETLLPKIITYAKKGIDLMPNNQLSRIIYAYSFFGQNEKKLFLTHIKKALDLNPKSPLRLGYIGFHLCLQGEWESGVKLLRQAMELHSGFPKTFYGVTTLFYYRQHDFENAYSEALKYDLPGLFWPPMLRAVCLGKMKRLNDAKPNVEKLFSLRPDFEEKGEYLIEQYVKEKELVDHVIDGLIMAGINIERRSDN